MSNNVIAIVISQNDVDVIDRTIESLLKQKIKKELFYIVAVDFGSTDGTYEKLLSFDRHRMGVYQVTKNVRSEQFPAEAVIFALQTAPSGDEKYYFTIRAGDTVEPELSAYGLTLMEQYKSMSPVMVIFETSIENEEGLIIHTPALYNEAFVIDGMQNYIEYLNRSYDHNVFCFSSYPPHHLPSYSLQVANDCTKWNNLFYRNYHRNALYVPKVFANTRKRKGEDSVFSVLSNYATLLSHIRCVREMYASHEKETEYIIALKNLAFSSLFNACAEFENKNKEISEDLLLLSQVVYPDIISEALFKGTTEYILSQGNKPSFEINYTLPPPDGSLVIDAR